MRVSNGVNNWVPLTRERIVEVAVDLARRDGLAGVSMRRVARILGVEAMSLYHHVPSKAALMVLMADRTISSMPAPDEAWPWDERLVELMVATYVAAVDNPAVFPVLASQPQHPESLPNALLDIAESLQMGASSLGLLEQVLVLSEQGQVPVPARVHIFRGLIGMVVGFAVGQVDGLLPTAAPSGRVGSGRAGTGVVLPPLLERMRPALDAATAVDGLRYSLTMFLHGVKAQLPG